MCWLARSARITGMESPSTEAPPDPGEFEVWLTTELRETAKSKRRLIRRIIRSQGVEFAHRLYQRAVEIQTAGGMKTLDGARRRSFGGVFLRLVRDDLKVRDPDANRQIFYPNHVGPSQAPKELIERWGALVNLRAELVARDMPIDDVKRELSVVSEELRVAKLNLKLKKLEREQAVQGECGRRAAQIEGIRAKIEAPVHTPNTA